MTTGRSSTADTTLAFFGSSLVSAYWNGAATYYRGVLSALHRLGYDITFYEPDAYGRQAHRDLAVDPEYARVVVYPNDPAALPALLDEAARADFVVKASGVGVFDRELEAAVAKLGADKPHGRRPLRIFWDVDAPATLERIHGDPDDASHDLLPRFDAVLTYGGGKPVVDAYTALGARRCVPIYNAHDPATHFPPPTNGAIQKIIESEKLDMFAADLSFLGNRLPDREARVDAFFFEAAAQCPDQVFLLGGSGWDDKAMPANVRYVGHVGTANHNLWNATPRLVLNISRASMATTGFSPATRVFEACAAGACLITDAWEGIEQFYEPDHEILVAHDGDDVARLVRDVSTQRAAEIGRAASRRTRRDHTYEQRAETVDRILQELQIEVSTQDQPEIVR